MEKPFDVVIIGGGLVGVSCALGLKKADADLSIAVVEANKVGSDYHPSFDDRSIALAQQSVSYLQSINAFNVDANFATPIKKVTVSDRGHFGKTDIDCAQFKQSALGYVVEVKPFGRSLHQQLTETDITFLCPDSVKTLDYKAEYVALSLASGKQLSAKLLVVADGANSPTRQLTNINYTTTAYQQAAIVANIEVAGGHNHHAFERFTEHGPMALLPMSNSRYSLVWCVPPEQVNDIMSLDSDAFINTLQKAFGYRGGQFTKVGKCASYPLVYGRGDTLSGHRTVLVGNAGHAIHPIAGQGFNLGLRDVQQLSELVASKANLGDYIFTTEYAKQRSKDINTVMTLTDSLVRLFSNSSRVLAFARNCGLFTMDMSQTLKAPLAKQLMGQTKQGK